MHKISLASGVVPEFGALETIRAAALGGFDAVGLWIEPPLWSARLTRDAKAHLARHELELLDVEVVWLKPGLPDPDHAKCVDIGAELGARNILVVSSDPDHAANAAKLRQLCEHAEPSGMRVALEFGLFTEIKTLGAALRIVAAADHPGAAVLIDPLHLSRSGGSPEDVARIPGRLLSYSQFCDAPATAPARDDAAEIIREAVDLRLHAGDGVLPLSALLDALPPDIPLSIELRSAALRAAWPDAVDRARATARATRRFLATVPRPAGIPSH